MNKKIDPIEPIDWQRLDKEVTGMPLEEAIRVVLLVCVQKINEIVERENNG